MHCTLGRVHTLEFSEPLGFHFPILALLPHKFVRDTTVPHFCNTLFGLWKAQCVVYRVQSVKIECSMQYAMCSV